MARSIIVRTVSFCARHPWPVVGLGVGLALLSALYSARHFAINTDIEQLIASDLPWHKRQQEFYDAFRRTREILVVVEAPTPEFADAAAEALAQRLASEQDRIGTVRQIGSGPFFDKSALLFLPVERVARLSDALIKAEPVLMTLTEDPSLRGALTALSSALLGVKSGRITLDDLAWPLSQAGDALEAVNAGRAANFSWRALAMGRPAEPRDLRRFILVLPKLHYADLQPGRRTSDAIRQAAAALGLKSNYQARVRLTGSVPMADDELASLADGALINTTLTVVAVLIILWLALRSARLIAAVFASLVVGLAITAALGFLMVGSLNLLSIAFAVLFIGLGVDFGIQFSVRYRSERHDRDDLQAALRSAAAKAGGPLALAAAATAIGFFSFLPTSYRGLGELGQIAGVGMLIAFATSLTLLPALLAVFNPPGEPQPMGFGFLAPVDRFTERHRVPILAVTFAVIACGLPLLASLRFDFNPLNLRNRHTESVATFIELQRYPETGVNSANILAPSLAEADRIAARLAALPEVAQVVTASRFVPSDQDAKLRSIRKAAAVLDPTLHPANTEAAPTDRELVDVITETATDLKRFAGDDSGPGAAAARRLSRLLMQLGASGPDARSAADAAVAAPLRIALDGLRKALHPDPVTVQSLPADLRNDWIAADGRARVQVLPKGDPSDTDNVRRFATAVLAAEPTATGPAVSFLESGRTVVRAFVAAGAYALIAIAVLLWAALRRVRDVLLTLVPLIVAGVVTLELCVLLDLPLNFANIIALPLLLGVGVAFKIYYIMAWRAGKTGLLQSTLTRAVVFSAMTTATAFGSLWLSNHPGTSSMGKLMALSLVCTMAAAVLFQPVLMGRPRLAAPPLSDANAARSRDDRHAA